MYIDSVEIRVAVNFRENGETLLRSSVLSTGNIKSTLQKNSPQYNATFDRVVLNLGAIPARNFNTEFPLRLAQAVTEYFQRHEEGINNRQASNNGEPVAILSGFNGAPAQCYSLATACLQPVQLQTLLQSPPEQLQELLKRLLADIPSLPEVFYRRATASRLAIAALVYFIRDGRGQRWLSEHYPQNAQLTLWAEAFDAGEIPAALIVELLEGATQPGSRMPPVQAVYRWLLPLWQRASVRRAVAKQADKARVQQIMTCFGAVSRHSVQQSQQSQQSAPQPQPASNAGIAILWPLLPQLFSLLELTQENVFTSDSTRWQAVACLDGLAWAEDKPVASRLAVNRLLCGIAPDVPQPELSAIDPHQQQQIDAWLTAVGRQLPDWQKLGVSDIRALFLQRPGDVVYHTEPAQIIVRQEAFDYLLGDWPWPLTMVALPWLQQPLTLIWPLPHLTG